MTLLAATAFPDGLSVSPLALFLAAGFSITIWACGWCLRRAAASRLTPFPRDPGGLGYPAPMLRIFRGSR